MSSIPKIFIAYAREDSQLLDELRVHLTALERAKKASIWYDGMINPGVEWNEVIKENLQGADIILLLVSPSAIASDYFYDNEMQEALNRHRQKLTRVVPLILRPCIWHTTPLAELQAIPKDGKAITAWANRDMAYHDAVSKLLQLLETIQAPTPTKKTRPVEHSKKFTASPTPPVNTSKEPTPSNFPVSKLLQWSGLALFLLLLIGGVYSNFIKDKSKEKEAALASPEVEITEPLETDTKPIDALYLTKQLDSLTLIGTKYFEQEQYTKARTQLQSALNFAKINKLDDTDLQRIFLTTEDAIRKSKAIEKVPIQTKPKAKTTPKPDEATPSNYYLVQTSATIEKSRANKYLEELRKLGYKNAEVIRFEGSPYYCIIASRHSSKKEANAILPKIQETYPATFVRTVNKKQLEFLAKEPSPTNATSDIEPSNKKSSSIGYLIQVTTTGTKRAADESLEKLYELGYQDAEIIRNKGSKYYGLVVSRHATRKEAEFVLFKLKKNYPDAFLRKANDPEILPVE